jgi:hypothetical protein
MHIRRLYIEILEIEKRISEDVSVFFNYQHREKRLGSEINHLDTMRKAEKIRAGHAIMRREHTILSQEKKMLDDIRGRLSRVVRLVRHQSREIGKIERNL